MVDAELLEGLCDWTIPRAVKTREGPKLVRRCVDIPKEFWGVWKEWKDELKEMGVRVFKDEDTDKFVISWFQDVGAIQEEELPDLEAAPKIDGHSVLKTFLPLTHANALLRPYQVPAVATLLKALRSRKFTIDASETGLGKTYAGGATALNLGLNFGVVCPANVVTKWTDTMVDIFGVIPEFVLSYNKLRNGSTEYVSKFERREGEVAFDWHAIEPVLLIFDEIDECANSTSLNAKLLRAAIRNPFIYVLGLSATATLDPRKMDDIGWGLGLHSKNDFWDWCLRNGCKPGFFGGLDFNSKSPKGEKALKNIHATIFPERAARLRRSDPTVAKELPPNVIIVEVVDTDKAKPSADILAELDEELAIILAKQEEDQAKAEAKDMEVSSLVSNTRERQLSELAKVPFIYGRLLELREQGRHVGVFLNYTGSISALEKLLGKDKDARWRKYVGKMTKKKKDTVLEEFNENQIPILILQNDAGSASIDLHDLSGKAPRGSIISPGYSARKLIQALGRMDRNGAKSDILQFIIFSADPVEVRAAKLVQAKLNNISLLNDGDLEGVLHLDVATQGEEEP